MTAIQLTTEPPARPRYYRSFASYEIPFRPDDPVDFAETQGLASFYTASHDAEGRVIRFEKLRLTRLEKQTRELAAPAACAPGATVYFRALRDATTTTAQPGEQLEFRATEPLDEFFVARVDASGQTCRAQLFRREIAFSDTYGYWPNGRLRQRVLTRPGQLPAITQYDQDGRPLPPPHREGQDDLITPAIPGGH